MNLMISTDFELVRHTHKYLAPPFLSLSEEKLLGPPGGLLKWFSKPIK